MKKTKVGFTNWCVPILIFSSLERSRNHFFFLKKIETFFFLFLFFPVQSPNSGEVKESRKEHVLVSLWCHFITTRMASEPLIALVTAEPLLVGPTIGPTEPTTEQMNEEPIKMKQKRVQCNLSGCSRVFESVRALNRHLKSHTRAECHYAGCNGIMFNTNAKLVSHLVIKHNHTVGPVQKKKKTIPCTDPACNALFSSLSCMNRHIVANECNRAICACGEKFKTRALYTRHMKVCTNVVDPSRTCSICKKVSSNIKMHQRHVANIHGPFKCLCSDEFKTKANLLRHMKGCVTTMTATVS